MCYANLAQSGDRHVCNPLTVLSIVAPAVQSVCQTSKQAGQLCCLMLR